MNYINILNNLSSSQRREVIIKSRYPLIYQDIINFSSQYSDIPWSERLYMYTNNIKTRPTCKICGSEVKFKSNIGYFTYCSNKCKSQDIELSRRIGDANKISHNTQEYKDKQSEINRNTHNTSEYRENFRRGMTNSLQQRHSKNYPEFIGYDENYNWIIRCPHSECDKCPEKQFHTDYKTYNNRIAENAEVCTKLRPIGIIGKNTNIEKFVRDILDKYNIIYITNDRKVLGGKELDIYIPSYKLGIECNGVYWHSLKTKDYHVEKYKSCKEKDIQLVTVWEDQILNNPEKIESILLSKLGIYERRLYARKCSVHLVDSVHCREFLERYHLQGSVNSSIRLGLYYNDELISVMTFGKGRKCLNSKDEWELYRYCCKSGIQVVGGASKLFKYFINNYHPNSVISFSSNDISDGSLYKVLGFEEVSHNIGYWYIKNNIRYHRYNFTKQKLIKEGYDPDMTESEIMNSRGYYKIYDSGQTKWIYTR